MTTIFSASSGEPAFDLFRHDLLSCLAKGMLPISKEKKDTFLAREVRAIGKISGSRENSFQSPLEGPQDLSLMSWFRYALQETSDLFESTEHGDIEPGYVDQIMICASHRKDYIPQPPPINLLNSWGNFAPSGLQALPNENGVQIYRPGGVLPTDLFAVAFFDQEVAWQGKTLVLELTPIHPAAPLRAELQLQIHPGNNKVDIRTTLPQDRYVSKSWNAPVVLPYGVPTTVTIPLEGKDDSLFKSLAMAVVPNKEETWPVGASVMVTRMLLIDPKSAKQLSPPAAKTTDPVDLNARIWFLDRIADIANVDVRVDRTAPPGKERPLIFTFEGNDPTAAAGRGGPVFRPPFVNADQQQLLVEIAEISANPKTSKAEVELAIRCDNGLMLETTLPVNGAETLMLDFKQSGFPAYVSVVGKNAARVALVQVKVVPKRK